MRRSAASSISLNLYHASYGHRELACEIGSSRWQRRPRAWWERHLRADVTRHVQQIGGWVIAIVLFGFFVPQINNSAHIGGMIIGALTAMGLGYTEKSRESVSHRILAGACMAVTLLVLLFALLRGLVFWMGF